MRQMVFLDFRTFLRRCLKRKLWLLKPKAKKYEWWVEPIENKVANLQGWPFFNTSNQEITIETFRFKDDNEYEIWLLSFFAYSKNIDSPESFILPFFTRKDSTVIFSEGGYALSRLQNDNTFNFW